MNLTDSPTRPSVSSCFKLFSTTKKSKKGKLLPLLSDSVSRWTRREQADFYRTVSSFGVVYDQEKKTFDWTQFRVISRLDKKPDESLEHYFYSFVSMCRRVCRLPAWKDGGEGALPLYSQGDTEGQSLFSGYRVVLVIAIDMKTYVENSDKVGFPKPTNF